MSRIATAKAVACCQRLDIVTNGEHEPREAADSGLRMRADGTGCLPLAQCSCWGRSSLDSKRPIQHDGMDRKKKRGEQKDQASDLAPQRARRSTEEQERTNQTRANKDDDTWQLEVRRFTSRCHKGCPDPKANQPNGSYATRVDPRPHCARHWRGFYTRVHSQPQRCESAAAGW